MGIHKRPIVIHKEEGPQVQDVIGDLVDCSHELDVGIVIELYGRTDVKDLTALIWRE